MHTKKTIVYIRASTGEQKLTLEFQKCMAIEKARELNLPLNKEDFLEDAGISGFTTTAEQRPAMANLLKMVANEEVQTVIVYKRDRLTRRAREYLVIAYTLNKYGVNIVFSDPSEFPFTTSNGWIIECIMAGLLQKECKSIRDKVVLGLKTKHKLGSWVGGSPGYGFSYDKDTKKISANQKEAPIGQEIIVKLAEGQDLGTIAAHINSHFQVSSRWTAAKVAKVASNPLFMGISKRFGESVKLSDFQPLVNPIVWHKAQETLKLKHPSREIKQPYQKTTLLDGLIFCGFNNKIEFKSKRQGGKEIYCCPVKTTDCDYPKHCFNHSFNKEELESKVFEYCKNSFGCIKTETLERMVQQFLVAKTNEIKHKINNYQKNLDRLRKEQLKKSDEFVQEKNINHREKLMPRL